MNKGLLKGYKKIAEAQLRKEANNVCNFFVYQPKLPASLKEKFRNSSI